MFETVRYGSLNEGRGGTSAIGADYYTFHGEIPWSWTYGSDVRTATGAPKRVSDRAFGYFHRRWRPGIPVEDTCRRWSWEDYHSDLNQTGTVVFPAPPIADILKLRVVGGSSDMVDQNGKLATIYRVTPGPGFGSHFLFIRRDLIESYSTQRRLRLLHAVWGERSMNYRKLERNLPGSIRCLFQNGANRFSSVIGLSDQRRGNRDR